jgi:hypothetical protein
MTPGEAITNQRSGLATASKGFLFSIKRWPMRRE